MADGFETVLAGIGPRLRSLRQQREMTLAELAEVTSLSVSTISRLESGQRKPNLELLLPIARAFGVPLDDVIGEHAVPNPRVHAQPFTRNGMTFYPLTRHAGDLQACKAIIPGTRPQRPPDPKVHEGYEWLYVLSGQLRLVLGEHDLLLEAGEAAEFDTRVPHFFDRGGPRTVEMLVLFGPNGERVHVRARPREDGAGRRAQPSRAT